MAAPGSLAEAQEMYAAYIAAEKACLNAQHYQIRDRVLTKADLPEIREGAQYWLGRINTLTVNSSGGINVTQVIPMDG